MSKYAKELTNLLCAMPYSEWDCDSLVDDWFGCSLPAGSRVWLRGNVLTIGKYGEALPLGFWNGIRLLRKYKQLKAAFRRERKEAATKWLQQLFR